jgi:divalent metal cation (Fe/Co/Zn/Cd) transporter
MTPSTTILIFSRHFPGPLLRAPLLLNDVIALPLCIISTQIPGIVLICLSLIVAIIDLIAYLKTRSRRVSAEESEVVRVNALRMSADAFMSCGLLITWIIALVGVLQRDYYYWNWDHVGVIAVFTLFLAWCVPPFLFLPWYLELG